MHEAGLLLAAIGLLLLANGFFSGAEIALISVRRSAVDALIARGSKAAARVKELKDDPDTLLATVQIGVTLMGTLAGVLGGYLASRHVEPFLAGTPLTVWLLPSVLAGTLVGAGIVYFELILGELVPKALALRFTGPVALFVAWPLKGLARVSRVFVRFLTVSTRAVLWVLRIRDARALTFVSVDEIKHLIREGRDQGVLDATEMELIDSVFEFSDTLVRKVMVPRPKIVALPVDTPPEQVVRRLVDSGFSRIPVYDVNDDNMVGLIYAKDVLRLLQRRRPVELQQILHPLLFVPETKRVGELFKEFQKRRTHMALVIDEHGSVTGLITLEDLIEEILGEIHDEYDWEEHPVERLRDGSLVAEGTVPTEDLSERFGIPIPRSDEYETVAGFMLDRLGTLPRGGEVVVLEQHRLIVVDVEKNRISKVKIEEIVVPVKS